MIKRSKYSEKTLCFTVVNHSKFTVVNHSKFTVVNHSTDDKNRLCYGNFNGLLCFLLVVWAINHNRSVVDASGSFA